MYCSHAFKYCSKSFLYDFSVYGRLYHMDVYDLNDNHLVWGGAIPRIQFERALCAYMFDEFLTRKLESKLVALLDNGDITSSNV